MGGDIVSHTLCPCHIFDKALSREMSFHENSSPPKVIHVHIRQRQRGLEFRLTLPLMEIAQNGVQNFL